MRIVRFTREAYLKLRFLLAHFNKEVGFYGLVKNIEELKITKRGLLKYTVYIIHDIRVYPQIVTSVAVKTDELALCQWYDSLSDKEFSEKRMQGHSHVYMPPVPSSVDVENNRQILKDIDKESFFIFFIFNKRMEYTVRLYEKGKKKKVKVEFPREKFFEEIENVKEERSFLGGDYESVQESRVLRPGKSD